MNPGDRIRDYILERLIGKGGMGEVWLARHASLGSRVAIKVMAENLAQDEQFRARFLDEARAMASLQHPRTVGATDFFEEGGRLFLVMPFREGRTLAQRLDEIRGPLPVPQAVAVAVDVLEALDYAHRNKVIHRDVKPSNIIVDDEWHACLTDFGIAIMVGDTRKTRTGFSLGTPHYMSPEQIERPKQVDHRTDVYAMGCVLFEMLAGKPPFDDDGETGDSDYLIKTAHTKQPPPSLRGFNQAVSPVLEAIVMRALEKDPARRFHGCGQFRQSLVTMTLPPATPVPRPSGPQPSPTSPARPSGAQAAPQPYNSPPPKPPHHSPSVGYSVSFGEPPGGVGPGFYLAFTVMGLAGELLIGLGLLFQESGSREAGEICAGFGGVGMVFAFIGQWVAASAFLCSCHTWVIALYGRARELRPPGYSSPPFGFDTALGKVLCWVPCLAWIGQPLCLAIILEHLKWTKGHLGLRAPTPGWVLGGFCIFALLLAAIPYSLLLLSLPQFFIYITLARIRSSMVSVHSELAGTQLR